MELSPARAATWTAGVGMLKWTSTVKGVNAKITSKWFTFPVGALVSTQLKLPVQTAVRLLLFFGDADAANNDSTIQVAVKVSTCPPSMPACVESHSCPK